MSEQKKPLSGGAMLASLPTETLPRKQPSGSGENKIIAGLREARLREAVPAPTILSQRNRK